MSQYIFGESAGETDRLKVQAHRDAVEPRLAWAGLKPGMRAVDAGCGPGETTRAIARVVGPTGVVHGFDFSPARIDAARAAPVPDGTAPMHFATGDVRTLPYPEGEADFVMCQYVLEYLPNPDVAIAALMRLLKPGGILLLVDGDDIGSNFWPVTPALERGVPILMNALGQTGFDRFIGRKLFHLAKAAGLADARLTTYPRMQIAGPASPDWYAAWSQQLEAMAPVGLPAFGSAEAWGEFKTAYLAMLRDESTFKFDLGVAVTGFRR